MNDSAYRKTKDNPLASVGDFERNLIALTEKAKKFTENIVFVGLAKGSDKETKPLAASTTRKCYDKDNVKIYDEIIEKVCNREKVLFISLRNKLSDKDFYDGLHPSARGHEKIFEEVRKKLRL